MSITAFAPMSRHNTAATVLIAIILLSEITSGQAKGVPFCSKWTSDQGAKGETVSPSTQHHLVPAGIMEAISNQDPRNCEKEAPLLLEQVRGTASAQDAKWSLSFVRRS